MKEPEHPKLKEFVEALERLKKKHGHIIIPMEFTAAISLVGALQLALRHPTFPENSRKQVEQFIYSIRDAVSSEPAIVDIIQMGFDPEHDQ